MRGRPLTLTLTLTLTRTLPLTLTLTLTLTLPLPLTALTSLAAAQEDVTDLLADAIALGAR